MIAPSRSPVIVALDHQSADDALSLVKQLSPELCRLKVGKHLFVRFGPDFVRQLISLGFDVFLDLKFHDIPNTVQDACRAAAELGVWMLNVHCQGGERMLQAAKQGVLQASVDKPPLLIGVTVLTSLDDHDLETLGLHETPADLVLRYARLAAASGLDGVVCSAMEAPMLREALPNDFVLVTPGIRLQADDTDDQRRVQTPEQAIQAGSDYLVVGRSITQAVNPVAALKALLALS